MTIKKQRRKEKETQEKKGHCLLLLRLEKKILCQKRVAAKY